jgi:hypothetical protein
MPHPFPSRAPAMALVLTALLVGCEPGDDGVPPDDRTIGGNQELDLRAYLRTPPDTLVTVTVTGCGEAGPPNPTEVEVAVEPGEAHVESGTNFRWVAEGDMTYMQIRYRSGAWPFQARELPQTPPGQSANAGVARGEKGDRSKYDVIVRCRNLILTIDPEIVIRDPGDRFAAF